MSLPAILMVRCERLLCHLQCELEEGHLCPHYAQEGNVNMFWENGGLCVYCDVCPLCPVFDTCTADFKYVATAS